MCGICGEVRFDGRAPDPELVGRMAMAMRQRGPDGFGVRGGGRVAFGHVRLQIIDLSDRGAQPMADTGHDLEIVFNGCIYNYKELRAELIERGHTFASTSDTEVILNAWRAWGPSAVDRFHGMFAFAIRDLKTERVFLARDRFGIKPFYYSETADRLRFASTLPGLLAGGGIDTSIDREALQNYMTWHAVVPPPRTILAGVRKLPPATIRTVEPDGRTSDKIYWRPSFERTDEDLKRSPEEWRDLTLEGLRKAVRRRMVADVPVGVLLSGGVDSSMSVALLAEEGQTDLSTFSIGFEAAHGERGDEFQYSDLIAERFETDHRQLMIPSAELLEHLPGAIGAMSEPMVSYDNIGFYLLSREVARHIKVVQSGQGADEVFAGYHWYPGMANAVDPVAAYADAFFDRDHKTLGRQLASDYMLSEDASRAFVEAHFAAAGADHPVDKALRIDTNVMLVDDPVKRVDCHSMAWSLEARVPFLDHELVELAGRIPPEHKLAQGGKGVLKDAARLIVPSEVIDRPKGYFPVPALKYLDGPYLALARDALESQAARDRGLFRKDYLETLFAAPADHVTKLRGSELWQAALLELWLQQHGV